jgi:hypothetical protein
MAYLPADRNKTNNKGIHAHYCLLVVPAGFAVAAVLIHWLQAVLY